MSNQVQIPAVKTDDDSMNQVQQNVNKVLRNIYGQLTSIITQVDELEIIGEIKIASITLDQFQTQAGKNWVLANGQNCVGSTYAVLTKNNTVPNISVTGATAFIRIN